MQTLINDINFGEGTLAAVEDGRNRPSKSIGDNQSTAKTRETPYLSLSNIEKISLQLKFSGKPDMPLHAIQCEICVHKKI